MSPVLHHLIIMPTPYFVHENTGKLRFCSISPKRTGNSQMLNVYFFSDMSGWSYPWFNCYIYDSLLPPFLSILLIFYIHKGWLNRKFSTMAGSFYKKLWHKRESGTASSAEVTQSDMLECGRTYKITLLLIKISFHNLCNLPVRWEESPAPTLSKKFSGDLSFFVEEPSPEW